MFKYLNRAPSFLDVAILPLLVICARDPKPAEIICYMSCKSRFTRIASLGDGHETITAA